MWLLVLVHHQPRSLIDGVDVVGPADGITNGVAAVINLAGGEALDVGGVTAEAGDRGLRAAQRRLQVSHGAVWSCRVAASRDLSLPALPPVGRCSSRQVSFLRLIV